MAWGFQPWGPGDWRPERGVVVGGVGCVVGVAPGPGGGDATAAGGDAELSRGGSAVDGLHVAAGGGTGRLRRRGAMTVGSRGGGMTTRWGRGVGGRNVIPRRAKGPECGPGQKPPGAPPGAAAHAATRPRRAGVRR